MTCCIRLHGSYYSSIFTFTVFLASNNFNYIQYNYSSIPPHCLRLEPQIFSKFWKYFRIVILQLYWEIYYNKIYCTDKFLCSCVWLFVKLKLKKVILVVIWETAWRTFSETKDCGMVCKWLQIVCSLVQTVCWSSQTLLHKLFAFDCDDLHLYGKEALLPVSINGNYWRRLYWSEANIFYTFFKNKKNIVGCCSIFVAETT